MNGGGSKRAHDVSNMDGMVDDGSSKPAVKRQKLGTLDPAQPRGYAKSLSRKRRKIVPRKVEARSNQLKDIRNYLIKKGDEVPGELGILTKPEFV